jgi:hypothetical protein
MFALMHCLLQNFTSNVYPLHPSKKYDPFEIIILSRKKLSVVYIDALKLELSVGFWDV